MARRRQNTGGGGLTLIVVLVVTAFGVIAAVVAFLFKLVVTAAFYAMPFAVGLILLSLHKIGRSPPALPNPTVFDDAAMSRAVAKLLGQQDHWLRRHAEQYDRGSTEGLYLTRGSEEKRFDTRSRMGRELNANLDAAEAAVLRIEGEIQETRARVSSTIPPWRSEFDAWVQRYAIKLSTMQAVLAFGLATVAFYIWSITRLESAYAAHAALLWNPLPARLLISPMIGASLVAYVAFAMMLKFNRQKLVGRIDESRAQSWHHVEAKWSCETEAIDFFDLDRSDAPHEQARSERRQEQKQAPAETPWHEVLGIAATASEAEIKAAYREAIKGYHSDRVASLGPKLRALAEEESKRINAAYDEARKARQFR